MRVSNEPVEVSFSYTEGDDQAMFILFERLRQHDIGYKLKDLKKACILCELGHKPKSKL